MNMTTPSPSVILVAGLGLVELVFALVAASLVDRGTTYPLYLGAYLAMGISWLAASHCVLSQSSNSRSSRWWILVVAVALRIPFLVPAPTLSDDVYRYVWDGRVQHAGINPYLHAPGDDAVAFLREGHQEAFRNINNRDIPTIYPPLMQVAFFLATSVSESIYWMKAFFGLADIGLVFVLAHLLTTLGLSPDRTLVYAWNPLVIVEVAGNGHNDVLAVLFLTASLAAVVSHRETLSIVWLTLSGITKIVGYGLTPLFLRWVRVRALLVMVGLSVAIALPYAGAGGRAFRGLIEYGARWRANDSLFHILYYLTGSLDVAKIIAGALLVTLVLALFGLRSNPVRASYLTVGAILLLTTTVHPWYLLWIAPFLAIYASPAWLFLTLSVALAYHSAYLAAPGEPWQDVVWVKLLEYVPFYALAMWSAWRERSGLRSFLGINSPP